MASLKEIRTRIASVASTRQITSAMKMVAASRLKKAQNAVTSFRPYASKMQEIMASIALSTEQDVENVFVEDRDYRQVLVVVLTSNRGLCGAFNSNVIKEALQQSGTKYGQELPRDKIRFMSIGKKGYDLLRKRNVPLDEPNTEILEHLTYEKAAEVAQTFMDYFTEKRYDCIDIVYNEFINTASQKVVYRQFLPLLPDEQPAGRQQRAGKEQPVDYLFEPDRENIIHELIPQNMRLILYEAMLESVVSEFGARMTAMHQATDNATALIQELTLQYNKARQASITNEILEITGGAEALNG